MHGKSHLPAAEAAVLPLRQRVAQGESGKDAAPQVSTPAERADGTERYQADRAVHAMLARLSSGISPAALLLAYADWLLHLASSPQRRIEIGQEALIEAKRLLEATQRFFLPGQGLWTVSYTHLTLPTIYSV